MQYGRLLPDPALSQGSWPTSATRGRRPLVDTAYRASVPRAAGHRAGHCAVGKAKCVGPTVCGFPADLPMFRRCRKDVGCPACRTAAAGISLVIDAFLPWSVFYTHAGRAACGELDRAIVALPFRGPTAPIIVDAIVDRSIDRRSILRTSSERCKRNNPNRRPFRRKRRFRRRSSTIDVDLP